jgi:hypothetical protein
LKTGCLAKQAETLMNQAVLLRFYEIDLEIRDNLALKIGKNYPKLMTLILN